MGDLPQAGSWFYHVRPSEKASEHQGSFTWSGIPIHAASADPGVFLNERGAPSLLRIAELIVPIGAFFSCLNTGLIPHYRRVFPKSEDDPESDYTIITTYQLEFRGIVEYYRLAYNLHTLSHLRWIMEQSLTKTLAHKHKTTVQKIFDKYKADIDVDGVVYKGLQVTVPREGKKPLVATWGGIPLTWDINDQPQRKWNQRSELERRLLAQVCEVCGATYLTAKIEVHHIRALKDLNKYEGREKPLWVKIMAARHRKTLVLCRTCHKDLHAGRPLRQKLSRSRTKQLR